MSSYKELVAQRGALEKQQAELDKQIAQAKRAERADVIAQIRALMAEHDLGLADLGGKSKSGPAGQGRHRQESGCEVPQQRHWRHLEWPRIAAQMVEGCAGLRAIIAGLRAVVQSDAASQDAAA